MAVLSGTAFAQSKAEGQSTPEAAKSAAVMGLLSAAGGKGQKSVIEAVKDFHDSLPQSYKYLGRIQGVNEGEGNLPGAEANLAQGRAAIDHVIKEHADVLDAMYRPDVGNISFYWGEPGKGTKFKGGHGISKIIAKHGEDVARMMPEVIAKGDAGEPYTSSQGGDPRINLSCNNHTAVLSLYKFGDRQTWLLTGWDDSVPGDTGSIYGSADATHTEATPLRRDAGAGTGANIKPTDQDGKPLFSDLDNQVQSKAEILKNALRNEKGYIDFAGMREGILRLTAPTMLSEDAARAGRLISENESRMVRGLDVFMKKMEDVNSEFMKTSNAGNLDFMQIMHTGLPQATPELHAVVDL